MKIPTVPSIEGFSDLMDLLTSAPRLKAHLGQLNDVIELVNKTILLGETAESIRIRESNIEARLQQVEQNVREKHAMADKTLENARHVYDEAKIQAESSKAETDSYGEAVKISVNNLLAVANQKNADASRLLDELKSRETTAKEATIKARQIEEVSHMRIKEAEEVKQRYTEKLSKLRSLAD